MSSTDRTQFDPGAARQMEQSENSGERHGTYEPDDSRNVTGASGAGIGAPGGADQDTGGERWGGQQSQQQSSGDQQVEFDADPAIERQGEVEFDSAASGGQQSQSGGESRQPGESYGENTASDQQEQFDASASGGQMGEIREHMEVIGADGVHLGTVDKCEGDRIKLTKADSGMGGHEGHHHYISRGLVAGVEGDKVRLSATAANAYGMTEEE